ncbi:small acid-soluble spore protein SspI [Haloplasma contractile]|uniref:Small acid-soluble spore protein I n=1 Tax=Haloplasma contractile SSD-17B TaxID=1033810 RepID=U2FRC7_9MOLU|nr:small acid-soluble spore protein SspI [Haloplasma contractile]ERJ13509.1 Small acid-soluble spore protein I [Haloplasma contractile SSD-17B]
MNIDIRKAVLANLNNANYDEVRETVEDAISTREEKTLPGLGVLFEVMYNGGSKDEKEELINKIVNNLKTS